MTYIYISRQIISIVSSLHRSCDAAVGLNDGVGLIAFKPQSWLTFGDMEKSVLEKSALIFEIVNVLFHYLSIPNRLCENIIQVKYNETVHYAVFCEHTLRQGS